MGVDYGITEVVNKVCVFFVGSSEVSHISKSLTMFRGAVRER